jgi:hypothetical protein
MEKMAAVQMQAQRGSKDRRVKHIRLNGGVFMQTFQ